MASITQNKKDGKIVSYKFRACVGRDEFGKQIFRCSTWKAPDGMTPSRAEKAAQKAAADWERQVKDEYKKDVLDPQRIKDREIAKQRTEFSEFALRFIQMQNQASDSSRTFLFFLRRASLQASIISSSVAFSLPQRRLSLIVPEKS